MSLREGTDQAVGHSSDLVCDFQELVGFLGVQITEALGDNHLCLHLQPAGNREMPNRLDKLSPGNSPSSFRYVMLLGTEIAARRTWLVSP
jgi:hypothetical protein